VCTSGNGVLLRAPYEDPRFDRSIEKLRKSITRCLICVPLKAADRCLGCIELANKRSGYYLDQDYQLTLTVAKELAKGLKAQELREISDTATKIEDAFRDNVAQVASENLLTPLLKMLLILVAELFKSEKCVLSSQSPL
jgi:hypothetical protein